MKRIIVCPECGLEKEHYGKGYCQRCYGKLIADPLYKQRHRAKIQAYQHQRFLLNKERMTLVNKINRLKSRDAMIEAYGGCCACCGEIEKVFLSIDHVYGKGRAHQKSLGGSSDDTVRFLKKMDWPQDEYQLLCMNCNYAKFRLGQCPHAKETSTARWGNN